MVIVVIARAYQTRAKAILFSTWKQEGAVALTVLRQCDSHTIATLLSFYILIGGKVAVAQLTIASILLLLATNSSSTTSDAAGSKRTRTTTTRIKRGGGPVLVL